MYLNSCTEENMVYLNGMYKNKPIYGINTPHRTHH